MLWRGISLANNANAKIRIKVQTTKNFFIRMKKLRKVKPEKTGLTDADPEGAKQEALFNHPADTKEGVGLNGGAATTAATGSGLKGELEIAAGKIAGFEAAPEGFGGGASAKA